MGLLTQHENASRSSSASISHPSRHCGRLLPFKICPPLSRARSFGLSTDKEWDKPEQKPVVETILATQMPGEANYMAWVDDAMAMTEKYH